MSKVLNHKFEIKTWIVILTFIIMLLSTFASVVAIKTNLESNVNLNSERIGSHEELTNTLTQTIQQHETRIVTIETNYNHILKALDRIDKKLED